VTTRDVYRWSPMPAGLTPKLRHHVLGVQANLWTEHIRTERQLIQMAFPRAAALAEIAWSPVAPRDWRRFRTRLGLQQTRSRRLGLAEDEVPAVPITGTRRFSQQLRLCSDKLALSLEDDAPTLGPHATFLVDLLDPCWIYPNAALTDPTRLTVSVGQVPFNFRIGPDRETIHLLPPSSHDGELQIRADRCDGAPILSLPLAPAIGNQALTRLTAPLRGLHGRHDLCFRFTGDKIDPLWVINWIQLAPTRVAE
jgi:hexosaminidase